MKKRLFWAVLAMLAGQVAQGQQPGREVAPPDPQLGALPDKISYVKTFVYQAVPPDPRLTQEQQAAQQFLARIHPQLDKLEVVKFGEIKKQLQHFTNGTSTEKWKSGEYTFNVESANPGVIVVTSPAMMAHPEDAAEEGDFAELAWLNRAAFHGEEVRQGLKCFVYKSGDRTAWLDEPTRLPMFFQSAKVQVAYTYMAAPNEPLQLPDRFVKRLETVKRAWRGGPSD